MLGRSNLIESDECWSTPGGGCTSTAEYAWAAINGSREGWNHHETLGAIQNAIGNRIVGSLRRMLKQTGGLFQQSAFCIPGFAPTRNGAGRHQEAHRLKQPIRMNGVRHLAPSIRPGIELVGPAHAFRCCSQEKLFLHWPCIIWAGNYIARRSVESFSLAARIELMGSNCRSD